MTDLVLHSDHDRDHDRHGLHLRSVGRGTGGWDLRPDPATDRAGLRPSWDAYFLSRAAQVASRSACTRRCVGAVLVSDHRTIGEGYNGMLPGAVECMDGGCPRGSSNVDPGSSYDTGAGACRALHAEQNALRHRTADTASGATLYLVCLKPVSPLPGEWHWALHEQQGPCDGCARFLAGYGIKEVVTP